jgi:hypothetical protein
MENFDLQVGQVWKHYKGGMYKILLLAKNVEEGDVVDMVVYQKVGETQPLTQSVGRFTETVHYEGKVVQRYEFISDN